MLPNPTLDKLQILRLHGMIKALSEQHATPDNGCSAAWVSSVTLMPPCSLRRFRRSR